MFKLRIKVKEESGDFDVQSQVIPEVGKNLILPNDKTVEVNQYSYDFSDKSSDFQTIIVDCSLVEKAVGFEEID